MSRVDKVSLTLVCLDGWKFEMQGGSSRSHFSSATDVTPLHVGIVSHQEFDKFCSIFLRKLEKVKSRTGEERSAATNKQGHQKTPSMIQALMMDTLAALENGDVSTLPRGGFTDVGLHTGGLPRNTAWPLMMAVLQTLLESKGRQNLYRIAMADFKLHCVENVLCSESPEVIDLDTVMEMLKAAVIEGSKLTDPVLEYDIKGFEDRCALIRSKVDKISQNRAANLAASAFVLPHGDGMHTPRRNLIFSIPNISVPFLDKSSSSFIQELINQNLGALPVFAGGDSWESLSHWLDLPQLQPLDDISSLLLVMNTVEKFAFKAASSFCADSSASALTLHSSGTSTVLAIVDQYRRTVAKFQDLNPPTAVLKSKLQSCELLVVWIAACTAHHATRVDSISFLHEYSFALDMNDLRHLVLSEKEARDAVIHVAGYIRSVNEAARYSNSIFSLRVEDKTIEFARRYSEVFPTTVSVWRAEHASADAAKDKYWEEVKGKLGQLNRLDAELQTLKENLNNVYESLQTSRYSTIFMSKKLELEAEIKRTRGKIQDEERPPAYIIQSLPEYEDKAMSVLFSCTCPINIRHYLV